MASSTSSSPVQRFGGFEVDPRSRELRRKGIHIRMQDQPLEILLLLIERKGEVVTREEIKERLWPAGTFVAADDGINTAIRKLREVLGDSAEGPIYIETIPRRGYRFIGPLDTVQPERAVQDAAPVVSVPIPRGFAGRKKLAIGVAASAAIGLAILVWALVPPLPQLRVTKYTRLTNAGNIGNIAGTDGSRIYFNLHPWGPVEQVGVSGGDFIGVRTETQPVEAYGISPDGTSLLLWSHRPTGYWHVGTLAGSSRFIADGAGKCDPRWSPDAKYIAYSDCQGSLFVMRTEGTDVHLLAKAPYEISDIAWSPDSGHIRLTMNDTLWEIPATGGKLYPLLPGWRAPDGQCCGRWTPDREFYLFLAGGHNYIGGDVGGLEQIWALDERHPFLRRVSRGPVQLTSGPIHWRTPIPSRDGDKIFAVGTTRRGELVQFDARTKTVQLFLGGISADFLDFSKDGSQLIYITYPDGIMWRAKADGTERVQLTSPPLRPFLCRWSPDGSQILFSANKSASRWSLFIMPARGGAPRRLFPGDDEQGELDGHWSPDGRKIVYQIDVPHSLRILDIASGTVSKVPGSDGLWSPRWSPDGRYLAAFNAPNTAIKIFDLQTQQWSTLVERESGWGFLTFSHNSRFIYALHGPGPWSMYRIPVPSGNPERIADLSDVPLVGAFGFWFGLDPNDRPLLLRNSGTSDIYALTLDRR